MKNLPYPQRIYTTAQIAELDLMDMPALMFDHLGITTCVQDAHLSQEEFLAVPGLADVTWRYIRTTREWIAVFVCNDVPALLQCVDIEPDTGAYNTRPDWWVTPKGHPREQYKEHAA